jgi:hypothetical protein
MLRKRIACFGLLLSATLSGAVDGIGDDLSHHAQMLFNLVVVIATFVFIFLWVHTDAEQRRFERSKLMNAGMLVLPLVFFPVYLMRSREKRERASAFLKAGVFVVLLVIVALVFEFAVAMAK